MGSGATIFVNGEQRREGIGANVLGSPMKALLWLANHLRHGPGIEAGAMVSTGTMTGLLPVQPGDEVQVVFDEMGTVECSFATEEESAARREALAAVAREDPKEAVVRRDSFGSLNQP